jgi:hypothetical protein
MKVVIISATPTHEFEAAIGDHLVHVHIARCPCSSLENIDWEMLAMLAGDDFVANARDYNGLFFREMRGLGICPRRSLLDERKGPYEVRQLADRNSRNWEVSDRPLRLGAIEGIEGNADGAKRIVFDPGRAVHSGLREHGS